MIHKHLNFLVSSWLGGRILDWRLSQPGFDPSFWNLACLATLKSSDRTIQACLWMTIYIYIYMCVCHPQVAPSARISLTLTRHPPYRPLLPTGLQGYILYRHRAGVCRFELVVPPLLGYVKGSTGIHHLWARPFFSSSIQHVWFV